MARNVAIVVGVHKPKGLPELEGTLNDAANVCEWATASGYECTTFTDETAPIRIGDLYDAIDALVAAQDVERLLIFFSGHGVSKGVGIDYWILSDGVRNPNGPVSVDLSLRNARRSGIPHVVVFADACRTTAGKREVNIEGASLFPNDVVGRDVHIDVFLATLSGDPAIERAQSDDALEQAYGIFTKCLLKALKGEVPAALEEYADHAPRRAVTAFPLERYLDEAVAAAAADLIPPIVQIPDSVPGSTYPPHVICWVPDDPAATTNGGDGDGGGRGGARVLTDDDHDAGEHDWVDDINAEVGAAPRDEFDFGEVVTVERRFEAPVSAIAAARVELEKRVVADVPRLRASGRHHFGTPTGLSVLGSQIRAIAMDGPHDGPFEQDGSFHVLAEESGAVVLDLGDDRYAACAMLRGYVGTLHVGEFGVDLVSYLPTPGADYFLSDDINDKTREQLAFLGAASRVGFRNWAIDEARLHAALFREDKFRNPSYGIFAAYAYDRAGDTDEIREMLEYFQASTGEVLYDFVLLAEAALDEYTKVVPGSYPLLSRGWGLLDPEALHPAVRAALRSLAPSVWATSTGEGGRSLFEAVKSGEVT